MRLLLYTLVCVTLVTCTERLDVKSRFALARTRRSVNQEDDPADDFGLEPEEDLQIVDSMVMSDGHKEVKYQETYRGLPIEGETVVIEQDEDGDYIDVYGRLVDKVSEDLGDKEPVLTKQQALQIGLDESGDTVNDIIYDEANDCQLEIKVSGDKARYVYKLSYFVKGEMRRPSFLIDAMNGQIILKWDSLNSRKKREDRQLQYFYGEGGNLKTGQKYYDGKQFNVFVSKNAEGECVLENDYVEVYNVNNTAFEHMGDFNWTSFTYNCSAGLNDEINGGYSALADAFYFSNVVHQMFTEWYGMEPLESTRPKTNDTSEIRETTIKIICHADKELENAFWVMGLLILGDGNSSFYPLSGLDVIAHELGHGLTEYHSGLIYSELSGGINEAFSDMVGVAGEYYFDKSNDWMTGFEIVKKNDSALRYLSSPSRDKYSIENSNNYCPRLDVHFSSGVFNKAFYLLANKWNIRDAFEVFLIANRLYWSSDSDFNGAACGVIKAASDVNRSTDDVREVFEAVGIHPCNASMEFSKTVFNLDEGEVKTVEYDLFEDSQLVVCFGDGNFKLEIEQSGESLFTFDSSTMNGFPSCVSEALDGHTGEVSITISAVNNLISNYLMFLYDRSSLIYLAEDREITDEEHTSGVLLEFDIDRSSITVKHALAILIHIHHSLSLDRVVFTSKSPITARTSGYGVHETMTRSEGLETVVYSCTVKQGANFLFLMFNQIANGTANVIDVSYTLIPIYQFLPDDY